ncbi:organic hydroperoxide resistance protein [Rhodanobacter glycinis]|uniref:organic hydroperoxide resistance protein n=1 Tax=Rhodanobacter glycinis TaxID=582702 RepID=UPI00112E32AA|nr:organic hydroperoxide resistance protein [Rhodanobacter glycinis]TPG46123.1 organic hydroperoxide resistance protein [Rhodanobacter glycinis]
MVRKLEKVFYTAQTHVTGGRDGAGRSSDGALDVTLSSLGSGKPGTNPEQLFGVGYSACFMGAMQIVGAAMKIKLPPDTAVDASVSLGRTENDTAYGLAVTLAVSLPGLDRAQAQQLVDGAHQACPYSHATRGNIEVVITLV